MAKHPVVFIHGLWMHSSTWKPWMQFFSQHGYETINPDWPGDGATVEESRNNTKAIANHTIKEVADGYAKVISALPEKPILIGHSFGGLMVQILLGSDLGAAGIARSCSYKRCVAIAFFCTQIFFFCFGKSFQH